MITYPPEKVIHRYLDDASHWKNSSWPKNVKIQETGVKCVKDTEGNTVDRHGLSSMEDVLPVDRCLSRKVDETCQLLFSLPICLIVVLCNAIKVVCMFLTAYDGRREILLTVGDAISSFLNNPDATSEGRCLLPKSSIAEGPQMAKIT